MSLLASQRSSRLRWQGRRGMKELDVLLERFFRRESQALDTGAWPELEDLLAKEDDVLWDWLQDPERADAQPFRALLERILARA